MRKVGGKETDWFHRRELFMQKWMPDIQRQASKVAGRVPKDDLVQHVCLDLTMMGIIKLWKMDKEGAVIPFIRDSLRAFLREWRRPFAKITSVEAKSESGEEFSLLEVVHVEQTENELKKLVPIDPEGRRKLHDLCVRRLEQMRVRRTGDSFSFQLVFEDKTVSCGGYQTRLAAQSAYTDCWRRIRDLCLPFFVSAKHRFKSYNKKQDIEFWLKVRSIDSVGYALPSFFYGDPLHALMVLEEMQFKVEHIYKIESIDLYHRQRRHEKKWRGMANGGKIEKVYRTLDQWKEILSQGLRDSEIVKTYGCSYGAIGAARARIAAGVKPRKLRAA